MASCRTTRFGSPLSKLRRPGRVSSSQRCEQRDHHGAKNASKAQVRAEAKRHIRPRPGPNRSAILPSRRRVFPRCQAVGEARHVPVPDRNVDKTGFRCFVPDPPFCVPCPPSCVLRPVSCVLCPVSCVLCPVSCVLYQGPAPRGARRLRDPESRGAIRHHRARPRLTSDDRSAMISSPPTCRRDRGPARLSAGVPGHVHRSPERPARPLLHGERLGGRDRQRACPQRQGGRRQRVRRRLD